MKTYFFHFEGLFNQKTEFQGLFSSVLMPFEGDISIEELTEQLKRELQTYDITLVEVVESYEFDPDIYDRNEPDNDYWFNWYDEVILEKEGVFLPWYTFALGT